MTDKCEFCKDLERCDRCGAWHHINQLDSKPKSIAKYATLTRKILWLLGKRFSSRLYYHAGNTGEDFDVLECRRCYGHGFQVGNSINYRKITFAKVGGPPDDWNNLEILLDGKVINYVIEVDTEWGCATVFKLNEDGGVICDGEDFATETIFGNFEIRQKK